MRNKNDRTEDPMLLWKDSVLQQANPKWMQSKQIHLRDHEKGNVNKQKKPRHSFRAHAQKLNVWKCTAHASI